MAAMVSGVAVAITMTPFDVISTRLYNQPVDELKKVRDERKQISVEKKTFFLQLRR